MSPRAGNRFSEFFTEGKYVVLKNYLYNYLLRKRAIDKCLQLESATLILEIGSGISPVATKFNRTVYLDLSFEAIKILKQRQPAGHYVVADGMQLPFKPNRFSHIICSEVLEHLADDLQALKEMARTLKSPRGTLIVTVPHRKRYFTNDDHFVNHYRRYEISEIKSRLRSCGLNPVHTQKILGPLEKVTMIVAVFLFTRIHKNKVGKNPTQRGRNFRYLIFFSYFFEWANIFYKGFAWLDAVIMPRSFSSVILIKSIPCKKGH
jgi:SAM-dependent methyltransferase